MNAYRLLGYAFVFCPLVIPSVIGMLMLATFTAFPSELQTAEPNQKVSGLPRIIKGLAKSPSAANFSARQPYSVELKLDRLPRVLTGERKTIDSEAIDASLQMALDDGQLDAAYGLNDDTYAYQFIWFNRFTPLASDFPFDLNEIWVMFDDTNINIGDEIDLVVYVDTDSNPANGATWLSTYYAEVLAIDGQTWTVYSLSPPLVLTYPGDVLIGVINRYVISGVSEPGYPAVIDTTTSQERSWIGWWTADPPDPAELPPDDTLNLMTGEYGGNWLIRGFGGSTTANLYIPIVMKAVALPAVPTLNDIANADGDGSYTVNWSASSLATSYALEEDDNADFSSPVVIYSGSGTTKAIVGKALGNYYYRVRAENGIGYSSWSAVKSVSVTQQPELICETHHFGTVGSSLLIPTTGTFDHFTAENNMLVETLEVKSMLKATFPTYVYVAVGINGERLANTTHYIIGNAFTPYSINRAVEAELHVGDDIYYYIARTGDSAAWIGWGNYVKLCGR